MSSNKENNNKFKQNRQNLRLLPSQNSPSFKLRELIEPKAIYNSLLGPKKLKPSCVTKPKKKCIKIECEGNKTNARNNAEQRTKSESCFHLNQKISSNVSCYSMPNTPILREENSSSSFLSLSSFDDEKDLSIRSTFEDTSKTSVSSLLETSNLISSIPQSSSESVSPTSKYQKMDDEGFCSDDTSFLDIATSPLLDAEEVLFPKSLSPLNLSTSIVPPLQNILSPSVTNQQNDNNFNITNEYSGTNSSMSCVEGKTIINVFSSVEISNTFANISGVFVYTSNHDNSCYLNSFCY
jgi:hypothetical protein